MDIYLASIMPTLIHSTARTDKLQNEEHCSARLSHDKPDFRSLHGPVSLIVSALHAAAARASTRHVSAA